MIFSFFGWRVSDTVVASELCNKLAPPCKDGSHRTVARPAFCIKRVCHKAWQYRAPLVHVCESRHGTHQQRVRTHTEKAGHSTQDQIQDYQQWWSRYVLQHNDMHSDMGQAPPQYTGNTACHPEGGLTLYRQFCQVIGS